MDNKKEKTLTSYKGFCQDMTCRDFQYEVGKEYEIDGNIRCCSRGFHACESPLDVLDFYFLDNDCRLARFCEVEQSGTIDKDGDENTKVASSKIKIKSELKFADFIKLGIKWIKEKKDNIFSDNDGFCTKIVSTDSNAQVASSSKYTRIGSNGLYSNIASSGDYVNIASNGDYAHIASSGEYANIASSGECAKIASINYNAKIGSSGGSAQIASNGHYAKIASNGYSVKIASSGVRANIATSGDYAKIASNGYCARIGSNGDFAKISSNGENSVIYCAGKNSIAKAKKGSWITLSEWTYSLEKGCNVPKCVKTEYVDGKRIKEDTWYKLVNGEFVEFDSI